MQHKLTYKGLAYIERSVKKFSTNNNHITLFCANCTQTMVYICKMSDTKYKQLVSPQSEKWAKNNPLENTPGPWSSQCTSPEQASFYRYYWL